MVYTGDAEKTQGKPRISSGRWRSALDAKLDAEQSRETPSIATTYAFLTHLRNLDIELFADGEKLRCNAPPGVITPALQAELAERKAEIMDFLLKGKLLEAKQWFSLYHRGNSSYLHHHLPLFLIKYPVFYYPIMIYLLWINT